MNPDLLKPVMDNPRVLLWVWQFYHIFMPSSAGIPMSFIGARKRTWKSIIKYTGNLQMMLNFYKTKRFVSILMSVSYSEISSPGIGVSGLMIRWSWPQLWRTVVSAVSPQSMDPTLTQAHAGAALRGSCVVMSNMESTLTGMCASGGTFINPWPWLRWTRVMNTSSIERIFQD